MLPHPFAGGECAHKLSVKPAGMLIIDVFNCAALFEPANCNRPSMSTGGRPSIQIAPQS